jgi:hypothetical protein
VVRLEYNNIDDDDDDIRCANCIVGMCTCTCIYICIPLLEGFGFGFLFSFFSSSFFKSFC